MFFEVFDLVRGSLLIFGVVSEIVSNKYHRLQSEKKP